MYEMEKIELRCLTLAGSAAIVTAVVMLLLGILGNIGVYTCAVEMMQQWHVFFSLSIGGIIAGMFEAAIIMFVFTYLFGLLYNRLS
jgi:hypothetical protein